MRIQNNGVSLQGQQALAAAHGSGGSTRAAAAAGAQTGGADAAKLAVSGQQSQSLSANAASRDVQAGLGVLGTARTGLDNTKGLLNRMEVALHSLAAGDKTDAARSDTQKKLKDLLSELDRVASDTNFNGKKLLDGSMAQVGMTVQAGSETFDLSFTSVSAKDLGLSGLSVSDDAGFAKAYDAVQTASQTVGRSKIDADQKDAQLTVAAITSAEVTDLTDVRSTLATTRTQVLAQTDTAALAQGNAAPQAVLALLR